MLRAAPLVFVTLVAAVILTGWTSILRGSAGWHGFPQPGRTQASTASTTRLFAGDEASFAALASRTAYPGGSAAGIPGAVLLAPLDDWRFAAALVPLGHERDAPILYFRPGEPLPEATAGELKRLAGEAQSAGARLQVEVAGGLPAGGLPALQVPGLDAQQLGGDDPVALAGELLPSLPHRRILFVEQARPGFALPALAWSAYSGDPVLFVDKSSVPDATRDALQALDEPPERLYLTVHDKSAKSKVTGPLKKYAHAKVTRIHSGHVAGLAVRLATWHDKHDFGWGLPSAGTSASMLLTRESDQFQAMAALPLLRTAGAGPLLVSDSDGLPTTTESFLWKASPARSEASGPFNRAWIIGDGAEMDMRAQAQAEAALQARPSLLAGPGLSEMEALALAWAAMGFAGAAWALYVVSTRPRLIPAPWRGAWPAALLLLGPLGSGAFVRRCLPFRSGASGPLLDRWIAARAFDLGPFLAVWFLASAVGTPALTSLPDRFAMLESSTALQQAVAGLAALAGAALYQWLLSPAVEGPPWWRLASAASHLAAVAVAAGAAWWFRTTFSPLRALPAETDVAWWAAALFAAAAGTLAALPFEAGLRFIPGAPASWRAERPAGAGVMA